MLVLSHRVGEKLLVGDGITVTVLSINGDQVRLGVDAPKVTSVYDEYFCKISQEKTNNNVMRKKFLS